MSGAHGLLAGKTAVVYGGGGSIGGSVGGAVARAFARKGAKVHLAGRTLTSLEAVAEGIRSSGGVATTAQVDALDQVAVDADADAILAASDWARTTIATALNVTCGVAVD
jgi:3-oxoacyl-[acyl-carrier protein] reductase